MGPVAGDNQWCSRSICTLIAGGATALATTMVRSPVGPIPGLIAGVAGFLSGLVVYELSEKLNVSSKYQGLIKVAAFVVTVFAALAAGWGVLAAMGMRLTLGQITILALTSIGLTVGVTMALGTLGFGCVGLQRT